MCYFLRRVHRSRLLKLVIGLVGFVVVAWFAFSRLELTAPHETTYIPKETAVTPEIRLLQQYVRVDTSNPPGNETAGARFLIDHLAKSGVKAELIEPAPGRGSVYARIRGKRSGEGLLLLSHIDVIPAKPEGWRHPPFAAEISLNQLWGRGTLDMKGITICQAEAFIAVARSGKQPERDLVLLATADEERGGKLGVGWLIEHRPDIFDGITYALNEGGQTEMEREKITYFGVEIGSKEFIKADVRTKSRDDLRRLRIALEPFANPLDPHRVPPEVKEYLAAVAPHRRGSSHLMRDIDATIRDGKFWALHPSYRALMQNNIALMGIRDEGDHFAMQVILQNLPGEDSNARVKWLEREARPFGGTVAVVETLGPSTMSTSRTPFFQMIQRNVRQQYGPIDVGPIILPRSTTDSRYLRATGITAYGLWPYPVDFFQTQGIHDINERVRLDWFMMGVEMMKRLVEDYVLPE